MQANEKSKGFSKARPYHLTDEHNANRDLFDQWLVQVGTGYHHLWRWKPCYVHETCNHCF